MISIVERYRNLHRRPQARHEIDLPRAHKMNIKSYKKKNTQFNLVRLKLGLRPRGENLKELY